MLIRLPLICILVSVTAIGADLSPERYWNTALPNTPMPNSLHTLFTPVKYIEMILPMRKPPTSKWEKEA
ncbi:unnamed protein product [Eruca vesicaria subsp. sativa]|uniref:Uncharacterized protein n=1 Tax=Eruca vesicaria subsp. sativa TaxID=29727 RepID=A0ABC8K4L4_ERUVS|nr:unnamed protein product [Eruca vesicaria subsp. sativa]